MLVIQMEIVIITENTYMCYSQYVNKLNTYTQYIMITGLHRSQCSVSEAKNIIALLDS